MTTTIQFVKRNASLSSTLGCSKPQWHFCFLVSKFKMLTLLLQLPSMLTVKPSTGRNIMTDFRIVTYCWSMVNGNVLKIYYNGPKQFCLISHFWLRTITCDLSVHAAALAFCCVHKTTWSNIGSCNFTYAIMRLEKFHSWMTVSSKTKSLDVLTMWREPGPPPWIPQEWSVERRPPCSQSELYQQPPVGTQKHTYISIAWQNSFNLEPFISSLSILLVQGTHKRLEQTAWVVYTHTAN